MTKTAKDTQIGGYHYQSDIQHIDYVYANDLGWCEANAVKYLTRHASKNGIEDVMKAIHYSQLLLEKVYLTTYQKELNK